MRKAFLSVMAGLMLVVGAVVVQPAWADAESVCDDPKISNELKEQAGCNLAATDTADKYAKKVIQTVLSVLGVVAVIMIIIGGIMYIISTGDAAKVHRAKNIILYSIIGLIVSLLAYAIVGLVVDNIG